MIVLGLVGTPAAGKSTVADYLARQGADWINADLIARDCLKDVAVIKKLTQHFGTDILDPQGQIDRQKMAERVFGSDCTKQENLRYLESVVHPETRTVILRRIDDAAKAKRPLALLDVPLLFESGWDRGCDFVWCIDAKREIRLRRAQNRGWDDAELGRREGNQISIETKSRLSNLVMRNDSTLDALHQKLSCHWGNLARIVVAKPQKMQHLPQPHCRSDYPTD